MFWTERPCGPMKLTDVSGDILPLSPQWKSQTRKDSGKSEDKGLHGVTSQKTVISIVIKQVTYICIYKVSK
jgi:hypothetical protein